MLKTTTSVINASQIATPITFAGDVTLSTGNLVIGTAGKGIDFSITGEPAGMTSELLADYEEGTWTPVVTSGAGTITSYTIQIGNYTKTGNLVTVTFKFTITDNGTGSSFLNVTLPFTSANESIGSMKENTLYGWQGTIRTVGNLGKLLNYNSVYPVATTSVVIGTVTFKV